MTKPTAAQTRQARNAIAKYGKAACLSAYHANRAGEGASSIAFFEYAGDKVKTTRQADAACAAGEYITRHDMPT